MRKIRSSGRSSWSREKPRSRFSRSTKERAEFHVSRNSISAASLRKQRRANPAGAHLHDWDFAGAFDGGDSSVSDDGPAPQGSGTALPVARNADRDRPV